jgi:integrase
MAVSVQKRGESKFQLRVTDKLLPKPFIHTFEDESSARNYGEQLRTLLKRGVVPRELLEGPTETKDDLLFDQVIRGYLANNAIARTTEDTVAVIRTEVAGVRLSQITYEWVEGYVAGLKQRKHKNLTPGSIRKRVGVLATIMNWHIARSTSKGQAPMANVFKLLPTGYSLYSRTDAQLLQARGQKPKRDTQRDKRLHPGDEEKILSVFEKANGQFQHGLQRQVYLDPAFRLLYLTVVDTGMRLLEAYRLRIEALDFDKRLIRVEGSKGWHGNIKPRTVPMKRRIHDELKAFCAGRTEGFVFPYWDGSEESRHNLTAKLSARFTSLFHYAGLPDLREHDLRHEATCRWLELRDPRGGWLFSDVEICRIMGWTNTRMMLRYASLRGEDLADRLKQI